MENMLKKGDVVVAKDKYLNKNEKVQDTLGIVVDYNPENDYLLLGSLHPEKYAFPPTFSMRGRCFRRITEDESKDWKLT